MRPWKEVRLTSDRALKVKMLTSFLRHWRVGCSRKMKVKEELS